MIITKYYIEEQRKGSDLITTEEYKELDEAIKRLSSIIRYSINSNCYKNSIIRLTSQQFTYNEELEEYEVIDNTCDVLKELIFNNYGKKEVNE